MIKIELEYLDALQFVVWENIMQQFITNANTPVYGNKTNIIKVINRIKWQINNQIYADHTVSTLTQSYVLQLENIEKSKRTET